MTTMKRCSKCGIEKPATKEYFHRSEREKDGFNYTCKDCQHEYRMAYRKKHADQERRQQRRHYIKNRQEIIQRKTKWQKNNPGVDAKKRALIDNLPHTFTGDDRNKAIQYFNGRCAVCGRPLRDLFGTHAVAMDHWIPLSSPNCPGTIPTNMIPLCHGIDGCNNKKHNADPSEWLEREFGKRKARNILKRINDFFASLKASS